MAEEQEQQEPTKEVKPSGGFGLFTWLLMGAIVLFGAVGGFAMSRLIGASATAETAQQEEEKKVEKHPVDKMLDEKGAQSSWLFEFTEPIIANLDEPGVTRYVRSTIILEISGELSQEKGQQYLTDKLLLSRDWLSTYFAGLSLEDVRGTRNLSRIKTEVRDHLNKLLFPPEKPIIQRVLFKEFAVQ